MIKSKKIYLLSVLFVLLGARYAQAYPDFIGYGYSSCVTCHYNGQGGGPLNDYGRALFSTEITARDIFPAGEDEEDIAASSGFLGSQPLPWWFRPGAKYRGLWFETDPNSKTSTQQTINMQNDVNLTLLLDKKQKVIVEITESYLHEPLYGHTNAWFVKEYFVRWLATNNFALYVGQLDKAYGIRLIDHTAVSREPLGLGAFDQSQGVIAHWTYPKWDVAVNGFIGNEQETATEKQKGFSATGEYEVQENWKVGASALSSKSGERSVNLVGATTRIGLSKGSAIIAEAGLHQFKDTTAGSSTVLGSYAFVETLINIRRGYNLLSVIEHTKDSIQNSSSDQMRWSFGTMFFPLPRTEVRLMAVNGKTFDPENGGVPDNWSLQSQLHLSF